MSRELESFLATRRAAVEETLDHLLPRPEGPAAKVVEAMRYATLGGGKRLRPILALTVCEALGGLEEDVMAPACAIEIVHAYSLVHDDLPAMDDDDLRRGRPTVHKAFGEAIAILAGDGLLTLAFEILAREPPGEDGALRRAFAVQVVAARAGASGMVGGQMADLEAEGADPSRIDLEWVHRHKTGAMFAASAEVGAIHAGAGPDERAAFARFGEAMGLAFQIEDDILDMTSTREELGKTPGKDDRAGKVTYPARFGLDGARFEARRILETALRELPPTLRDTRALHGLAFRAIERAS